jgi:aspartyl protease family protein
MPATLRAATWSPYPAARALAAAAVLWALAFGVHAESVALTGMMGSKALLVVNGSAPRLVGSGDTYLGVRVISTSGDQAVVEQSGKRVTLRVGDAPVNLAGTGAAGRGSRIVLSAGQGGHFMTPGQINGRNVQFMVDTGATAIAMSSADADRAGIPYRTGQPVNMSTANGMVQGYRIKLNSVRVGDVEVFDVDAVVTPLAMPYMLLGNSFLTRFQMVRENDQMTLVKRY